MANKRYFTICEDALPPYFAIVLEAKERCEKGEAVSKVCRDLDISRSTYYKYKDQVFISKKPLDKYHLFIKKESLKEVLEALSAYLDQIVFIKKHEDGFRVLIETDLEKSKVEADLNEYLK